MKIAFIFVFLWAASAGVTFASPAAKGKGTVNGKIIDKRSGAALEFATVSLLDTAKNVVAGSVTRAGGEFVLANVAGGQYTLKVSFLGYADAERAIAVPDDKETVEAVQIELEADAQTLEEAVVTSRRPVVERQIDKLVVTVANSVMAQNSTALEVLRKAPGLRIDKDGNISLNGQGVAVWVDNRPTQLSGQELVALLEGTEGSTIDRIEIIDQPSSKYDAEGSGGIVNIITRKNFLKGFNGSLRTGYTQYLESDFFYGANGSLNLNYRTDLINAYVNLSSRGSKGFDWLAETTTAPGNYYRQSEMQVNDHGFNQNIKAGIDFFIDKKNIIGVIGNFALNNRQDMEQGNTLENNNGAVTTSIPYGDTKNRYRNGSANLNYSHYFDEKGHELTANADYLRYTSTPEQRMATVFSFSSIPPKADSVDAYTNRSAQDITVLSAKADYALPVGKSMKLEAGGKMAISITDNEIVRNDSTAAGWIKNTNLSNEFTYRETVGALYATYGWKINDRWNVKGGVRWEHTASEGQWRSADSVTARTYDDFFPTVFVGYNPSGKHNISFSYTRRIRRPNYWQLNPFRRYISAYSYIEGNPELSPEYSHRFSLSYTGFQVFNAGVFYFLTKNQIIQVPVFDTESHGGGYKQGNFGQWTAVGASVGLSELPLTPWWSLTVNADAIYINNADADYTKQSFSLNGYGSTTFLLGKTWKAEVEYNLQTPLSMAYFNMKSQSNLNIGVQKTFWNNKGSLSLYVNDIFATNKEDFTANRDGVFRNVRQRHDSRSVRASFSYRFGNAGKPAKQRNVGQQEEAERLGGN
ncbi:MAG: TonB-dependent receptor [Prevotellaceae bacterium]|jgi:outer membrane receptor for ferrienterochelin and colicin|nr:TonB-dependent receptor [Prevotellaceae bacterium]